MPNGQYLTNKMRKAKETPFPEAVFCSLNENRLLFIFWEYPMPLQTQYDVRVVRKPTLTPEVASKSFSML